MTNTAKFTRRDLEIAFGIGRHGTQAEFDEMFPRTLREYVVPSTGTWYRVNGDTIEQRMSYETQWRKHQSVAEFKSLHQWSYNIHHLIEKPFEDD